MRIDATLSSSEAAQRAGDRLRLRPRRPESRSSRRKRSRGDYLWTGCVPTKALVATAKVIKQATGDRFGLEPHRFEVPPRRILE